MRRAPATPVRPPRTRFPASDLGSTDANAAAKMGADKLAAVAEYERALLVERPLPMGRPGLGKGRGAEPSAAPGLRSACDRTSVRPGVPNPPGHGAGSPEPPEL